LLTSAAMRRRPSRPPPPSGRRPPGPPFPPRPPTLEDARRWSTASARSEAEPRTRTAARPLTSAAMRCRPSRPPPPPGRRPPVFPLHSIFVASAMRRARQTGPGPSRGSTSPAGAGRAQAPARRETRTADTLRVVHASLAPLQRRRTLWLRSCRRTTASWWRPSAAGGLRQAGGGLRQAGGGQQTASTSLPYSLSLHRAHPPRHRHPPHLVVADFGHQNALETMSPLAFTATL
jgi:hypothetical protein